MATWIFTYNQNRTSLIYQTRCLSTKNQLALGDKALLSRDGRVFGEAFIVDINTWDNLSVGFAGLTVVDYENPACANKQGRPYGPICKVK